MSQNSVLHYNAILAAYHWCKKGRVEDPCGTTALTRGHFDDWPLRATLWCLLYGGRELTYDFFLLLFYFLFSFILVLFFHFLYFVHFCCFYFVFVLFLSCSFLFLNFCYSFLFFLYWIIFHFISFFDMKRNGNHVAESWHSA